MSKLNPITAISALLLGALAGFFSHDSLVGVSQTQVPTNADRVDTKVLAPETVTLRKENADLMTRISELESELERRQVPTVADSEVQSGSPADATKVVEATFHSTQLDAVLAAIDWKTVGTNMRDMVPLLAKLGDAIGSGEKPDLDAIAELQRLNADLVNIAKIISDGDVPGAGTNGAFTHPVVAANQIAAVLDAAGLKLDINQRDAMNRVMSEYAALDHDLRVNEQGRETRLEVLLDEVRLKHDFYNDAKGVLNRDQFNALYNEKSSGRSQLDLFDTGIMLAQFARPLPVSGVEAFIAATNGVYQERLGLSGETAKQLGAVIAEWSQTYPSAYWGTKADSLEMNGMMKSSRIRIALARQIELTRSILGKVALSPAQREQLLSERMVLVPLPR